MRIIVDAFGGDNAPTEVVKGAIAAAEKDKSLEIVLVGRQDVLSALLAEYGAPSRIQISHAPDVIGCDEEPAVAVRRKKESSIVRMYALLADADGAISAGSTGAVLTGGIFLCGRIRGVKRPALCPIMPTATGGHVALVDCGANTDCKPEYLLQFAQMGAAYMKCVYGVENPRVGLLSNGAEAEKGNELVKAAHQLIEASDLRFVRNVEAREIMSGEFDVVVADGFNGNIALKSAEGTAAVVFSLLKEEIKGSFRAKLGALLLKPAFKNLKKRVDYTEYGGAAFLGVQKPFVKVHGSAKAKTFCAAILQCANMVSGGLVDKMKEMLQIDEN